MCRHLSSRGFRLLEERIGDSYQVTPFVSYLNTPLRYSEFVGDEISHNYSNYDLTVSNYE